MFIVEMNEIIIPIRIIFINDWLIIIFYFADGVK